MDGSEVSRDSRSGDVLAEILLQSKGNASQKVPVVASFSSPWPLATGSVFDVECRNPNTGEGSFMAVTRSVGSSTKLEDLTDSFFVEELTRPTGRFSFYGTPTDMKVRNSITQGDYRVMELSFSILAQSTQAELPRRARLVATYRPEHSKRSCWLDRRRPRGGSRVQKGSLRKWSTAFERFRPRYRRCACEPRNEGHLRRNNVM
jgi:hypothetical protein